MFWPVVLPFQITCAVLFTAVILLTLFASPRTWGRDKTFFLFSALAFVAFVPACTGIMSLVDSVRFGDFQYSSYSDIPDWRSQRYLPELAIAIQMRKHANGYFARYKMPNAEFKAYLEDQWKKYGQHSAVERNGFMDEGKPVDAESFNMTFAELGWNCPPGAIVYYSPSEADGGGATYYVDAAAGLVYQRTGFW